MKRLDRFVLKSFIGPLVLTFTIVLFIQILQFLFLYIDELAGKGLELKTLGELLFQFSLTFVPLALPLAILLAALMTFGNLGENFELAALKASGISLQRIMRPLIFLIILLSMASFFFSNNVLPYSNRKARTLLYDIRRKRPELNIPSGSFYNGIDGFSIKISSKDPETNMLEKVFIYDHRNNQGNTSVIYADSGYMKITPDETGLILNLFNGYSYLDMDERDLPVEQRKFPFRRDRFKEQTIVIKLSGFDLDRSGMDLFKTNSSMLNISELSYYIDSLDIKYSDKQKGLAEEYVSSRVYGQSIIFDDFNEGAAVDSTSADSLTVATSIPDIWTIIDTVPLNISKRILTKAVESIKTSGQYVDLKQESLYLEMKSLRRYQVDWHKKFTLSFACLVFFFIGAPLGAIIRKGGLGTPAVISILFFVVYYVLSLTGEKFAKESILSPFTGMWIASFILLPIGIFLTYKATTDSALMNTESYTEAYNKFIKKILKVVMNEKNEEGQPKE